MLSVGSADFILGEAPPPEALDQLCTTLMSDPRLEAYAAQHPSSEGARQSAAPDKTSSASLELPKELAECDGDECSKKNPGTWIFTGTSGVARQPNGSVADLTIEQYDADKIVIRRVERPNSSVAGLSAVYNGKLHGGRIDGTVVVTWPGRFPDATPKDTIQGPWFAEAPRVKCSADSTSRGEDGMEIGGMAVRFRHPELAFECFVMAANQGNTTARALVGYLYLNGIGTAPNPTLGLDWLETAANAGDYNAQLTLGQVYATGTSGVASDAVKAAQWKKRADENPKHLQDLEKVAQAREQAQFAQTLAVVGFSAIVRGMTSPW